MGSRAMSRQVLGFDSTFCDALLHSAPLKFSSFCHVLGLLKTSVEYAEKQSNLEKLVILHILYRDIY